MTQTFEVTSNGNSHCHHASATKRNGSLRTTPQSKKSAYQELTKSCDRGPEFSIAYVNESLGCEPKPNWYGMTVAGFMRSLNTTMSFSQPQIWIPNGINVERLGPSNEYIDSNPTGTSNNFADLATTWTAIGAGSAAAGRSISPELVDKAELKKPPNLSPVIGCDTTVPSLTPSTCGII